MPLSMTLEVAKRNVALDPDLAWFDPPDRDYVSELKLRQALSTLPDGQREVIILHLWGDLTFSQAAKVLDISANTAASRYRYGLVKLRDTMCAEEKANANC